MIHFLRQGSAPNIQEDLTITSSPEPWELTADDPSHAALLDQLGHESGPTGLVAGADTGSVVSVKRFVEQDQIPPMRVLLELLGLPIDGTPAVLPAQERARQTPRQLCRNLCQVHLRPGSSRIVDGKAVA